MLTITQDISQNAMPKLNYVLEPKKEMLEVLSEREMDFSTICQNFDHPPELEPFRRSSTQYIVHRPSPTGQADTIL